jgi:hypothetical protein
VKYILDDLHRLVLLKNVVFWKLHLLRSLGIKVKLILFGILDEVSLLIRHYLQHVCINACYFIIVSHIFITHFYVLRAVSSLKTKIPSKNVREMPTNTPITHSVY